MSIENPTNKPPFKKVLIIEDNEIDRFVAKRMLEKRFFCEEVVLIESAPKALSYLKSLEYMPEELPQFIFLDIRMPEMDGFGFLEEYEKLPTGVKTNCIMLMLSSSLDAFDHERAAKNPYINRFLNKPLNTDDIDELLKVFEYMKGK